MRLLLASLLAVLCLAVPFAAQAITCTFSTGSALWGPIGTTVPASAHDEAACNTSHGGDDHYIVQSGATVLVVADLTWDGITASTGLVVQSGGTLIVDVDGAVVTDGLIITMNDLGIDCQDGSTCIFDGAIRAAGCSPVPALLDDPPADGDDYIVTGDYIPCLNGDCSTNADQIRFEYADAAYDVANGQAFDACYRELFTNVVAGEDILVYFDPNPSDSYVPYNVGQIREITAVSAGATPSIDVDIREGVEDGAGSPIADRDIQCSPIAGAQTKGDRIIELDNVTAKSIFGSAISNTSITAGAGSLARVTTSAVHGLSENDVVEIRGTTGGTHDGGTTTDAYDGIFRINFISTTAFDLEGTTFGVNPAADGTTLIDWADGHIYTGRSLRLCNEGLSSDCTVQANYVAEEQGYLIYHDSFGTDGCDGCTLTGTSAPDHVYLYDKRGIQSDVSDNAYACIDYGDRPGIPAYIAAPIRLRSATADEWDSQLKFNGAVDLQQVVCEGCVEPNFGNMDTMEGGILTDGIWRDVWIKDGHHLTQSAEPSGAIVSMSLETATDWLTINNWQMTGAASGANCGGSGTVRCDLMHGHAFTSGGNFRITDGRFKYLGDAMYNGSGGNPHIELTRVGCERTNNSNTTSGYLDINEGCPATQSACTATATVTDGWGFQCSDPQGAGQLLEVESNMDICEGGSEPGSYCFVDGDCAGGGTCTGPGVFPSVNWIDVSGFLSVGEMASLGSGRNLVEGQGLAERAFQDMTVVGLRVHTEPAGAAAIGTGDWKRGVIRDAITRDGMAIGSQSQMLLQDLVIENVQVDDRLGIGAVHLIQGGVGVRRCSGGVDDGDACQQDSDCTGTCEVGTRALQDNLLIIDPSNQYASVAFGTGSNNCESGDACGVIRLNSPRAIYLSNTTVVQSPDTLPTFNVAVAQGSGWSAEVVEVKVDGVLVANFIGGVADQSNNWSAGNWAVAEVERWCHFNSATPSTIGSFPADSIFDFPPQFINPTSGNFLLPQSSRLALVPCGAKRGSAAPGVRTKRDYHWMWGIEPELGGLTVPGGVSGGGGSDSGSAF